VSVSVVFNIRRVKQNNKMNVVVVVILMRCSVELVNLIAFYADT